MRVTVPTPAANDMETLGERLKRTLDEQGISQRQLAQRLAGSRAPKRKVESVRRQIVRWANDQAVPEPANASRLAAVLGTEEGYFTAESSTQTVAEAIQALASGVDDIRAALLDVRDRVRALEERTPQPRRRRGSG